MMMSSGIGIVPGLGLRIADLSGDAELYEGLHDPVDGGPGNSRITGGDCLVDLVRCRVIAATGKNLQSHPSLESQGNSLRTTS